MKYLARCEHLTDGQVVWKQSTNHEILSQFCFNVGPPSATLTLHHNNIVFMNVSCETKYNLLRFNTLVHNINLSQVQVFNSNTYNLISWEIFAALNYINQTSTCDIINTI